MYAPLAIANTIVARHPGRTTMGICKLVYLVQGWSLALDLSIVGTLPEVWRYGPVHRDVYDAFHRFGHTPPHAPQPPRGGVTASVIPETDTKAISVIDQVVDRYSDYDDKQLSSICHAEGSPWKLVAARHGFSVPLGTTVDETLIASHFKRLLEEGRRQEREAA
jgi:uncharacterized phage-associated protein